MSLNADGPHRQPVRVRTGTAFILCMKSALWVASPRDVMNRVRALSRFRR